MATRVCRFCTTIIQLEKKGSRTGRRICEDCKNLRKMERSLKKLADKSERRFKENEKKRR